MFSGYLSRLSGLSACLGLWIRTLSIGSFGCSLFKNVFKLFKMASVCSIFQQGFHGGRVLSQVAMSCSGLSASLWRQKWPHISQKE